MKRLACLALLVLLAAIAPPVLAQEQAAEPLSVGAAAPDFELPGATRDGVLEESLRLSDYEGQTVVLAFFFKARTRG